MEILFDIDALKKKREEDSSRFRERCVRLYEDCVRTGTLPDNSSDMNYYIIGKIEAGHGSSEEDAVRVLILEKQELDERNDYWQYKSELGETASQVKLEDVKFKPETYVYILKLMSLLDLIDVLHQSDLQIASEGDNEALKEIVATIRKYGVGELLDEEYNDIP